MVDNVGHGSRALFRVVVLGTGPVGKTSLINAMLGRTVGETGAAMGTTRVGQAHTHRVDGVDGTLLLTDTPGLGEAGTEGAAREDEAIDLATHADLLVFVVDHDLTRGDCSTISELALRGKRLIVTLNKKDRFVEADRNAVIARPARAARGSGGRRRHRGGRRCPGAGPGPCQEARRNHGNRAGTRPARPRRPRITCGGRARARGRRLARGQSATRGPIARAGRARPHRPRSRAQAAAIVEKHQWLAAVTAFANPVIALGPMAVGAVQLRMLSEMAAVYEARLSAEFVEKVGNQMAQTLLKLGVAEMAASVLAGFFKFNPLGFAAGGLVQAVTMGYLTRLTGASFIEYLERGQSWGEGGMHRALSRSSKKPGGRSGSCNSQK